MTKKEMSEIFAVMLLAYPNAEIFKGGIQKLAPTIQLWVSCLPDVDFWEGQQAVYSLVRECKFPPTIAEFREKVDFVRKKTESGFDLLLNSLRNAEFLYGDLETYYQHLGPCVDKYTIDRCGGISSLYREWEENGHKHLCWNAEKIKAAYLDVIKTGNRLTGETIRALPPTRKELEQ